MLDFDASKLIIVGIIALIFIPPKDLPRVLRQAGQFVGKMRRMASEFQGQFMDAMREADMADLRKEAQKLADSAKVDMGLGNMGLGDIDAHNRRIMEAVERRGPPQDASLPPPNPPSSQADAHTGPASSHEEAESPPKPIAHSA